MRLLHLSSRYWPAVGGGERYLQEIAERLATDGHNVTVATSDAYDTEYFWNPAKRRVNEREQWHSGVRILHFPLRHLPLAPRSYAVWRYIVFWLLASAPVLPTSWLARLARFTPWSPELWRWIDTTTEVFDVVSGSSILYEPFVAAAGRAAQRWCVPLIIYPFTHLGASPTPGRDSVSRYYTMRHQIALVRQADQVLAMTPTESAFYQRHGVPAERLQVVGAGVTPAQVLGGNAERFREQYRLRGPVVAFISAMAYDKGAMHLVEAVRCLWAKGRSVELVIAGTLLKEFRRYLASLPASDRDRIRVLPSIPEAEKRDLLAAADIVAMPSRTDSFGIIYLEAWLYQKPVIGARAWGMGDVIRDGEDGVLVPFGDVRALVNALAALLDDPGRRAAMGLSGAAKVRAAFTWDHCYARIRDTYARLAASDTSR